MEDICCEEAVVVRSCLKYFPDKVIGYGRNGTIVYEGAYGTYPHEIKVAVKRILKSQFEVSREKISDAFMAATETVDIVHLYCVGEDENFIYPALWLCDHDLHRLVQDEPRCADLYQKDGYPKPLLLNLMRNIVDGLLYLHDNHIIHGDLNPSHVLIYNNRARISLMGSRCVFPDHETPGWQSPEQVAQDSLTGATDVFNLGCVFFFLLTKGKHPFDESKENMMRNMLNFSPLGNFPEAKNLLKELLIADANSRLKASNILRHPLFWSSLKRMTFLEVASWRVEPTETDYCSIVAGLESLAEKVFTGGYKIDPKHVDRVEKHRTFRPRNVQDLLLAIQLEVRELRSHCLRKNIEVSSMIEEVDYHFRCMFPDLLMVVYSFMWKNCKKDPWFYPYSTDTPF